jgi:hypothetical protein
MIYEQDLEAFEAQIAHDKEVLSAYQRNELARGNEKEETAQEIEKLKTSIASLEQMVAWLRYKSSAE